MLRVDHGSAGRITDLPARYLGKRRQPVRLQPLRADYFASGNAVHDKRVASSSSAFISGTSASPLEFTAAKVPWKVWAPMPASSAAVTISPGSWRRLGGKASTSVSTNVGRAVFDAVLPLLNVRACVPLCGMIAQYNDDALPTPDRLGLLTGTLLRKRIEMEGFIVLEDCGHLHREFSGPMISWLEEGQVEFREDIVDGLENAPQAFLGLLEGKNFDKLVIRVASG